MQLMQKPLKTKEFNQKCVNEVFYKKEDANCNCVNEKM